MPTYEGVIMERGADWIRVVETESNDPLDGIRFHLSASSEKWDIGQRVVIEHEERMTRSIPPQTNAIRIRRM